MLFQVNPDIRIGSMAYNVGEKFVMLPQLFFFGLKAKHILAQWQRLGFKRRWI
jgi:hypothetical protein